LQRQTYAKERGKSSEPASGKKVRVNVLPSEEINGKQMGERLLQKGGRDTVQGLAGAFSPAFPKFIHIRMEARFFMRRKRGDRVILKKQTLVCKTSGAWGRGATIGLKKREGSKIWGPPRKERKNFGTHPHGKGYSRYIQPEGRGMSLGREKKDIATQGTKGVRRKMDQRLTRGGKKSQTVKWRKLASTGRKGQGLTTLDREGGGSGGRGT